MDDSDSGNDPPPTSWTKSKSEWEWEQARRKRLERVAQKIKKPGSAKRENARPSRGAEAEHSSTAGTGSEATTPRSASKRSGYEDDVVDREEFARSQNEWQALCKDKDTRIAKEAAASSQMRKQVAALREELEQVG